MARKPAPRPEVAAHKTYLDGVAKHLADKLLDADGRLPPGTTFADLEELLVQLGRAITQHTLTRLLRRDANAPLPADAGLCPPCATPGVPDDPEPRAVATRAGDTAWDEPRGTNRVSTAPAAGGIFSPQSGRLGLGRSGLSPGVLAKVIHAGATLPSFATASDALSALAEVDVPAKMVERRVKGIGTERCGERDAEADADLALPRTERKGVPAGVAAPDLAVAQMDGGRLQIFDRTAEGEKAAGKKSGRFWREDKVGLLVPMTSAVHFADPCPAIPTHFLKPARIERLVREIKANAAAAGDGLSPSDTAVSSHADGRSAAEYEPPAVGVRTVVATTRDAHRFGELLAAAAWRRGFYGAGRRAFVGDGSNANWGVWARHFSSFTPVVDFIHALTDVYQGAMAGRSVAEGWPWYAAWIAALWSGDVGAVIAGLAARQAEVGEPDESDGDTHPRRVVAGALGSVRNQQGRMRYGEYRRDGLPITSCHVESAIQGVNRRVKGTEKFWSPDGAEAILQLRADLLSETDPLDAFWARRAAQATGERRHRQATPDPLAA